MSAIRLKNIKSKLLRFISPIYYLYMLTNLYVWGDDVNGSPFRPAPFNKWFLRIGIPLIVSFLLELILIKYITNVSDKLNDFIVGAYPSLLGFSIGLYALALTSSTYEDLKKNDLATAKLIAIDLAYPLYIFFITLIAHHLLSGTNQVVCFLLTMLSIYSMLLYFDIITAVYFLTCPSNR